MKNQDYLNKISEKIISTIAKQTRILDDNIYLTQLEINKLNRDLKIMKEDYAKMMVKSYKSRSEQSRIMFVLSSNSFLQAYKRVQYMKQYAGYRKRQAEEIKIKQARLGVAVTSLQTNKKEKEVVIVEKTKIKEEHEKLKQYSSACGLSTAEFMRQLCRGNAPQPQPEKEFWELLGTLYEVHVAFKKCIPYAPSADEICREIEDFILELQRNYTLPQQFDMEKLTEQGAV